MIHVFETLNPKKLVGLHVNMSFSENKTDELWRGFMPRRREIPNTIGNELYSLEIFPPGYFEHFNPMAAFEKWAAVEVSGYDGLPQGFETLFLTGGLYAVFQHKGPASAGPRTYRYIFEEWLPNSGYRLDHRPHFAVMGEKYKHEDPDSEEEIWIPVVPKE